MIRDGTSRCPGWSDPPNYCAESSLSHSYQRPETPASSWPYTATQRNRKRKQMKDSAKLDVFTLHTCTIIHRSINRFCSGHLSTDGRISLHSGLCAIMCWWRAHRCQSFPGDVKCSSVSLPLDSIWNCVCLALYSNTERLTSHSHCLGKIVLNKVFSFIFILLMKCGLYKRKQIYLPFVPLFEKHETWLDQILSVLTSRYITVNYSLRYRT